jgi:hypothetical protein
MATVSRIIRLAAAALAVVTAMACPSFAQDDEEQTALVGRVYYIKGDLLRYVSDDDDWVAAVKDSPVGVDDTFYSGNGGMAELIAPNGSWVRMGNDSQLQFITLNSDLSEMDIATGMARFYNKGSEAVIKVASPFGYVIADPDTVFDFYVGENSVEVVAIKGTVSFVQLPSDARYDVAEGSPSIIADQDTVSSGEGTVDAEWDDWNESRDNYWSGKNVKTRSAEYLPPSLEYDSDVLDENGEWELLPYEGRNCWFWRPTAVVMGWSPFTMGIWTVWRGDETWIPAEPFGYVTHHYGNWVYLRNGWYWAPPVARVRIGLPLLDVSFWWCPGRVSWIHSGDYVGWVPLAPREIYYSHRNWGGRYHRVVRNETVISINITNYTYARRAIIVKQGNFHSVDNYRNHRENINSTAIKRFKAAPVINNTVIRNYTSNKQRYNYSNVTVNEKPHSVVTTRIKHNESIIRQEKKKTASELKQQVRSTREGKINRDVQIEAPKATNYIVPASEANRPKTEIKFQQKAIKVREKSTKRATTGTEQQPGRQQTPAGQQQPGQIQKPAVQPERTTVPTSPSQREKTSIKPEDTTTLKELMREKQAVQPGRTETPSTSGRQQTPAVQQPSGTASPSKSDQQEKQDVRPGRTIAPSTPSRQETPAVQQQPNTAVTPSRPGRQEAPAVQQERVLTPSKPTQPETPAAPAAQPKRVVTPSTPVQPETPAVQPNRVFVPATPTEKRIEKSNKTEKSESSAKKVDSKEKQKKSTEQLEEEERQRQRDR